MTMPRSIRGFLDEFERALKLSGRRRRRVMDEVREHLVDATERRISAGMDTAAAESAAVDAFGDAAAVASRFDRHFLARIGRRISDLLDTYDALRAGHTTVAATLLVSPIALSMAVLWSPWMAMSCIGPWGAMTWIGNQLAQRTEPGYRCRLWGWKSEHPRRYQVATSVGSLFSMAPIVAFELLGRVPHASLWLYVALVPLMPVIWILNSPRPYAPPPISAV
jgi:hypothetical protein